MIELHFEPRVVKTWGDFLVENPPFSIALDGYVQGQPAFSEEGPHANFDHHEGINRLSTRSTCIQVFLAVNLGLFESFRQRGEPFAHVWVNDCDQDTCLAVWLLRHPERTRDLVLQRPLARLLLAEDLLDCTAGAYPAQPDRRVLRQQAWVFEPYTRARMAGQLSVMDGAAMETVMNEVGQRISLHSDSKGQELALDTAFQEIGGGPGWKMIRELGPHARTALFASGIRAFISIQNGAAGGFVYSIGKMSPFVRFPLGDLYEVLDAAEIREGGSTGWGGSDTIGGSPREGGSRLAPDSVERLVNGHLARMGTVGH